MIKKRFALYCALMILALSGCGKADTKDENKALTDQNAQITTTAVSDQSNQNDEISENTIVEKIQDEGNLLYAFKVDNNLVCINKDESVKMINIPSENDKEFISSVIYDSKDIFYISEEYVYDTWIGKIYYLDERGDSFLVTSFDYSNEHHIYISDGKLCIISLILNEDYNGYQVESFTAYQKNFDGTFTPEEVRNENVEKVFEPDYDLISSTKINEQFRRFGKIFTYTADAKNIKIYDKEFNLINDLNIPVDEVLDYWPYCDGEYVVLSGLDTRNHFILNTNDGSVEEISKVVDQSYNIVGFDNGKILLYKGADKEYNVYEGYYYTYDIKTKELKELFYKNYNPGASYEYNQTSDFVFDSDDAYFVSGDISGGYLYRFNMTQMSEPVMVAKLADNQIGKFGEVSYISKREMHEETNEMIYGCYTEVFQFTKDYPAKDKINEYLKEQLECPIKDFAQNAASYREEYDPEFPYYCSLDYNISDVFELGSEYVSVNVSGYDYEGGAHGMPFKEQYLFDINTGDIVEFSSIYSGDGETFKSIVADYSLKYYQEHSEDFFAFKSDEDAYNTFYEDAGLDMWKEFDKEGIKIIYSPYQYGPFSSGYIEVVIPYNELGIVLK